MNITIVKKDLDELLRVYCQFLVEENQQDNLRNDEKRAISNITKVSVDKITGNYILSLCGYR